MTKHQKHHFLKTVWTFKSLNVLTLPIAPYAKCPECRRSRSKESKAKRLQWRATQAGLWVKKYQTNQMNSNDPSLILLNSIQIVGWAEESIMLHFATS